METIFAVSSGMPPAAIAVIRISGPKAIAAAERLAGTLPGDRLAGVRPLVDGAGVVLDRAMLLVFEGPRSATGEDVVEFHCHGGRAVIAAVEAELAQQDGLRRAEPGEFTRRALINGKIDLAQAEGLADLLSAETELQRRVAMGSAEGRLSQAVAGWRARVADLAARIEAMLDFADEDDVADDAATRSAIHSDMLVLGRQIEQELAQPSIDRLRDGIRVAIGGPPNSGKSTLLNLITQRQAAIVSPVAGTTRDRIEVPVSRLGVPFVFIDTAGLTTHPADEIEAAGIGLAHEAIAAADILLWLGEAEPPCRAGTLWVQSRADLPGREHLLSGRLAAVRRDDASSIDHLWELIAREGERLLPHADGVVMNERQRALCSVASGGLIENWTDPLVGAELLRNANHALAEIIGLDATESMLDALFGRFCIGK